MTAEQELINELAENGTDKQRELFLKFQTERNKQTERICKCIMLLAYGTANMIGIDALREIAGETDKINPSNP